MAPSEPSAAPNRSLALVTVVVPDYDVAIAFFTDVLGFALVEDTPVAPGKRWVVLSPGGGGADILCARAATAEQAARIGDQAGGRVGFFLETDEFERDYVRFSARGLDFLEAPREESYGLVAKFRDPFGNLWDLLQRKRS